MPLHADGLLAALCERPGARLAMLEPAASVPPAATPTKQHKPTKPASTTLPSKTRPSVPSTPTSRISPTAADHQARSGADPVHLPTKPHAPKGSTTRPKPAPTDTGTDSYTAAKQRIGRMNARELRSDDAAHLDRKLPPKQRLTAYEQQQKMLRRANRAGQVQEPTGLTGQALKNYRQLEGESVQRAADQRKKDIEAAFWSKRDTYVDDTGTVFRARYNAETGELDLARQTELDVSPPKGVRRELHQGQRQLDAKIADIPRTFEAPEGLAPQAWRAEVEGSTALQADLADKRQRYEHTVDRLTAHYYAKHPVKVEDGKVYHATVDPTTNAVSFELQPDTLTLDQTATLYLNGSRTNVARTTGQLPGGVGSEVNTLTEDYDPDGKLRSSAEERSRTERIAGVQHKLDTRKDFDSEGRLRYSSDRTQVIDDVDGTDVATTNEIRFDTDGRAEWSRNLVESTDAKTAGTSTVDTQTRYDAGVAVRQDTHVDGQATDPESQVTVVTDGDVVTLFDAKGVANYSKSDITTTSSGSTEEDDQKIEFESVQHTVSTLYDGGAPIYKADGTPTVEAFTKQDITDKQYVIDGGQDDGYNYDIYTERHAEGYGDDLVFDPMQHVTEWSRGKDGDKGSEYDQPIDPVTGAVSETPPDDFQIETYDLETPEQYETRRAEAWVKQNVEEHDDRSGWRQFKDGATKVLAVGAAIAGTALLFTGVGSPLGAALLGVAVIAGGAAFASTAYDYKTGRNHVSKTDLALSGVAVAPFAGAGLLRSAGGVLRLTAAVSRGSSTLATTARLGGAARSLSSLERGALAARSVATTGADTLTAIGSSTKFAYGTATALGPGVLAYDVLAHGRKLTALDILNVAAGYGGARAQGQINRGVRIGGARTGTPHAVDTPEVRLPDVEIPAAPRVPLTGSRTGGGAPGVAPLDLIADGAVRGLRANEKGTPRLPIRDTDNRVNTVLDGEREVAGYAHYGSDGFIERSVVRQPDGTWRTTEYTDPTNRNRGTSRTATPDEIPAAFTDADRAALLAHRSEGVRSEAGTIDPTLPGDVLTHITRRHGRGFQNFLAKLEGAGIERPERITPSGRTGERVNGGGESLYDTSVSVNDVQGFVRDALANGTWRRHNDGYAVVYDTGRPTIGTGSDGAATSTIEVLVHDGRVESAYPKSRGSLASELENGFNDTLAGYTRTGSEGDLPGVPHRHEHGETGGAPIDFSHVNPAETRTDFETFRITTSQGPVDVAAILPMHGTHAATHARVVTPDGGIATVRIASLGDAAPAELTRALGGLTDRFRSLDGTTRSIRGAIVVRDGVATRYLPNGRAERIPVADRTDGVYTLTRESGVLGGDTEMPFAQYRNLVGDRVLRVSDDVTHDGSAGAPIRDGWYPVGRTMRGLYVSDGTDIRLVTDAEVGRRNADRLLSAENRVEGARANGTQVINFYDAARGNRLLGTQYGAGGVDPVLASLRMHLQDAIANLRRDVGIDAFDRHELNVYLNEATEHGAFAVNGGIHFSPDNLRALDRGTVAHELGHVISDRHGAQHYASPGGRRVEEVDASILGAIAQRDWKFSFYDLSRADRGGVPHAARNFEEYKQALGVDGHRQRRAYDDGVHRDALFLAAPFVRLERQFGWSAAGKLAGSLLKEGKVTSIENRGRQIRSAAIRQFGLHSPEYRAVSEALDSVGMPADLPLPNPNRADLLDGPTRVLPSRSPERVAPTYVGLPGGRAATEGIAADIRAGSSVNAQVFTFSGPVADALRDVAGRGSARLTVDWERSQFGRSAMGEYQDTGAADVRTFSSAAFDARTIKRIQKDNAGNAQALQSLAADPDGVMSMLRLNPKYRTDAEKAALRALGFDGEAMAPRLKNHAKVVTIDGERAVITTGAFAEVTGPREELTFTVHDRDAVQALDRWMNADSGTEAQVREAAGALQDHDIYVNDPAGGSKAYFLTNRLVAMVEDVRPGERLDVVTKNYAEHGAKPNVLTRAIDAARARGVDVHVLSQSDAEFSGVHGNSIVTPRAAYSGTAHISGSLTAGKRGRNSREIGIVSTDPATIASIRSWSDQQLATSPRVAAVSRWLTDAFQAKRTALQQAGDTSGVQALVEAQNHLSFDPRGVVSRFDQARADAQLLQSITSNPSVLRKLGYRGAGGAQRLQSQLATVSSDAPATLLHADWLRRMAARAEAAQR